MKIKKIVFAGAALLLIGGAGFAYWRNLGAPTESPYLTVPVSRGNVRQVVSSTGTLQAVVTVQVGSQVSGTIEKLLADFNTKVNAGQVVAQLNQDKFKAAVDQARANVLAAQANHAKAKVSVEDALRTLERSRELRKRELMAQSDLDAAQTAYDAAVAQLNVNQAQTAQAQAGLNQSMVDLNNTVIRSPVDGMVISRNIDVGQTVAASLQAPTLFTIANDLAKMEVHTSVDEADVGNVRQEQPVTFTVDAFPARRFRGKVHQVRNAPTIIQNVVTYDAVVRIDNKDLLLKPGMTANVQFLVSEKEDALTIPNMALRFKPPEEKNESQELLRQEQSRTASPSRRAADESRRRQRQRGCRCAPGAPGENLLAQRRQSPTGRDPGWHHRRLEERGDRQCAQGKRPDHYRSVGQRQPGSIRNGQSVPAGAAAPRFPMSELIRVEDVHKTYRMGDVEVPALRGINLTIAHSEFVAVMGSSGSGKSTLMNILGCLDRPNTGKYFLEGHEVGSLKPDQWAYIRNKRIGFVFQGFNLLSRTTALENVELPMMYNGFAGQERHQRAIEVLSLVGLDKRLDHTPNQLSGGQQQRVAIARALVNRPSLILADEPTGNLDSATSNEIMALFQQLNTGQGITIILVTHEADIAAYARRQIIFRDGLVISDRVSEQVIAKVEH